MLSTLGKIFCRGHTEIFFLFFSENRIGHFMNCQVLFSGEKKKENIINLASAELAKRVVKVKDIIKKQKYGQNC